MSYYDTIEEDLKRARAILERGKQTAHETHDYLDHLGVAAPQQGGTIYGGDTYAAYKLLESFVDELERRHRDRARVLRVRYDVRGGHVHCRVFSAPAAGASFGKCGELVFSVDEWPEVRARLEGVVEILPEGEA